MAGHISALSSRPRIANAALSEFAVGRPEGLIFTLSSDCDGLLYWNVLRSMFGFYWFPMAGYKFKYDEMLQVLQRSAGWAARDHIIC